MVILFVSESSDCLLFYKLSQNMSDDKRRRARVQGGWAAPAKDVRSDRNKMKPAPAPAWMGRNVDQCKISPPQDSASHEEKKYVYHEPDEV